MRSLSLAAGLCYLVLSLSGCNQQDTPEYDSFLEWTDQDQTERNIGHHLEPVQVISLADMGVLQARGIGVSGEFLYTIQPDQFRILKINRSSGELAGTLDYTEGRGPGEVQRQSRLLVTENRIGIADRDNLKVAWYDGNGQYLSDQQLGQRFAELSVQGSRTVTYRFAGSDSLFQVYGREGQLELSFGEGPADLREMMRYAGYVTMDASGVYFAGYSEPFIRGYSHEGDLLFSRSTVDNYDLGKQYEHRQAGNRQVTGFARDAKLSTVDLEVLDGYLVTLPKSNSDPDYRWLDLYGKDTGEYRQSIELAHYPRAFTLDRDHIYTLRADSLDNHFIEVYENPL